MRRTSLAVAALALGAGASGAPAATHPGGLGLFTRDGNVGHVAQAGRTAFDPRTRAYTVVGGGDDLWAAHDDFHFVSRPATGNVAIAATLSPASGSAEPHSKGGVMIRQDRAPDSPYADLVIHQNGLVALQYRETRGGETHEIQLAHTGPGRVELVREGAFVTAWIAGADGRLRPASGAVQVRMPAAVSVGLLVCSHSDTQTRTVTFSDVRIGRAAA